MADYRFPPPPHLDGDDLRSEANALGVQLDGLYLDEGGLVLSSPLPVTRVAKVILAHRGRRTPPPRTFEQRLAALEAAVLRSGETV